MIVLMRLWAVTSSFWPGPWEGDQRHEKGEEGDEEGEMSSEAMSKPQLGSL